MNVSVEKPSQLQRTAQKSLKELLRLKMFVSFSDVRDVSKINVPQMAHNPDETKEGEGKGRTWSVDRRQSRGSRG